MTIGSTVIDATNTLATAVISAGTIGQSYQVLCSVITAGGLMANSVITLLISEMAR